MIYDFRFLFINPLIINKILNFKSEFKNLKLLERDFIDRL